MKQQKPILHGRDHGTGGADPIPGLGTGGGGIDFDQENTGGELHIDATADVIISGAGGVDLLSNAGADIDLWSGRNVNVNAGGGYVNISAEGADNAANLTSDGGVAAIDGNKGVELYLRTGGLKIATLPTVDPGVANKVWADNGTLVLSGHTAGGGGGGGITSIGDSTPTSLTGLLKGNGTDVDVAVAGTDYATPAQLSSKVDRDAVEAATNRLVAVKLAAGDAQPAFQITGNGRMSWGPGGGSGVDTSVYRADVNTLGTNGGLWVGGNLLLTTDSAKLWLGAASDVNVYRGAAGLVKTDHSLQVANNLQVDNSLYLKTTAGAVGGAQSNKLAIYSQSTGLLVGYVPIYAT